MANTLAYVLALASSMDCTRAKNSQYLSQQASRWKACKCAILTASNNHVTWPLHVMTCGMRERFCVCLHHQKTTRLSWDSRERLSSRWLELVLGNGAKQQDVGIAVYFLAQAWKQIQSSAGLPHEPAQGASSTS